MCHDGGHYTIQAKHKCQIYFHILHSTIREGESITVELFKYLTGGLCQLASTPFFFVFVFCFCFFILFCFLDKVLLCTPGWLWTLYVAQAGFKPMTFLPQSPKCWNYRNVLPYLAQNNFPKSFLVLKENKTKYTDMVCSYVYNNYYIMRFCIFCNMAFVPPHTIIKRWTVPSALRFTQLQLIQYLPDF